MLSEQLNSVSVAGWVDSIAQLSILSVRSLDKGEQASNLPAGKQQTAQRTYERSLGSGRSEREMRKQSTRLKRFGKMETLNVYSDMHCTMLE